MNVILILNRSTQYLHIIDMEHVGKYFPTGRKLIDSNMSLFNIQNTQK